MPVFLPSQPSPLLTKLMRHRGLGRALRWLAYLYLGWVLLCVLVLTPLLNYAVGKAYQTQTGRQLHYDLISINPFSLNLLLVNAYDRNPDQSLFWQLQRADINLALWRSLFKLAPGLDALSLQGLAIHLEQSPTGVLNIADIVQYREQLASSTPVPEPDTASTSDDLFPFFIHRVRLQASNLSYREVRQPTAFHQAISNLQFSLDDFSTRDQTGQPYRLSAYLGQGHLSLSGELSLAANRSLGSLQLEALPLPALATYWQPQLGVSLHSGNLSAAGDYQLDWQAALRYQLDNGQVVLNQLTLRSQDPQDLHLQLAQLAVAQLSLNSRTQQLHIANVALDQPHLVSWSNGAELGLLQALGLNSDSADIHQPTANHSSAAGTPADNPWDVRVDKLALREGDISWTLAELDNRAIRVQHLNIEAAPLVLSGAEDTGFTLSATAETAPLQVKGSINPITLNGQLDLDVQQLPLELANSQLKAFIAGRITQGNLNTRTQVTLVEGAPEQILSSGSLTQFVFTPLPQQGKPPQNNQSPQHKEASPATITREEALRFEQMVWTDTRIEMTAQQLHLPRVQVSGLDGRFMITREGGTNLDALLIDQNEDDAVTDTHESQDKDARPWAIDLDKLELENASFRFNDASLTPQFTAAVQNFSGELTGLSSDTRRRADFTFKGNVDGYAPVLLQGQAQPFLPEPMVKADLQFKHLDLGGLSTYSSNYAGWRIERGQLTADLNYHLEDGRILGENHIEMDKLQLGERVRSTQAMDIPIRLALAMITDSNGLAVLDMRVKGNTQDPQFDLSQIIISALKNTLKKIVTAPFRLLASLVKTDEELEILPFNSGSPSILATANRRLDALHNALNQRPLLNIDLQGRYDPVSDTRGLQMLQANSLLLQEGLTNQDIKQKNNRWEVAVKQHYVALPDNHGNTLSADSMFESWIATLPVENSELQQLALNRASTAKQHLVQKFGIDPARVFINNSTQCKEENPAECRRRAVKLALHNTWDLSGSAF